jgi:hypothetical protein
MLLALYLLIQHDAIYTVFIIWGILFYWQSEYQDYIKSAIRINSEGLELFSGFYIKWENINSYEIRVAACLLNYMRKGRERKLLWDLSPYSYNKNELNAAIEFYSNLQPPFHTEGDMVINSKRKIKVYPLIMWISVAIFIYLCIRLYMNFHG